MREVVQFLSDSEVYFDFSTRLLHLEDGTSITVHDYQSNLLHLFVSNPDAEIPCRQIASPDFTETPFPENYQDSLSTSSDNQLALEYMHELWSLDPILRRVLIICSRFGYVYNGNKLMLVEDDWKPALAKMVDDQPTHITNQVNSVSTETEASFPYEGEKPFVFVSYAHNNSNEVMGILNRLKECGLRIWYDEGIEWGSEWPQAIAEHLKKCTIFLAFHSTDSIASHNCRQEVAYAIKNQKTILSIYLEQVILPDGMDMQLSLYQAVQKKDKETVDNLADRLIKHKMLQPCIEQKPVPTIDGKIGSENKTSTTTQVISNDSVASFQFYPIVFMGSALGAVSSLFILTYITAIEWPNSMVISTVLLIFASSYFSGSSQVINSLKDKPANFKAVNNWIGLLPFIMSVIFSIIIPLLANFMIGVIKTFVMFTLLLLLCMFIFGIVFNVGEK